MSTFDKVKKGVKMAAEKTFSLKRQRAGLGTLGTIIVVVIVILVIGYLFFGLRIHL